ncbi:MAG: hypothetical protein HZB26_18510 [Candidatus Hydrogenedentes bacterium]|nr:hypothetical protein [Candidatus Hydrogenedentota bacterium]
MTTKALVFAFAIWNILVVLPALAASIASSEVEPTDLNSKTPKELAELFVSGDLEQARAAASVLARDWQSIRANYDLLVDATKKTMDKQEAVGTMPELPRFHMDEFLSGETKEHSRSLLILGRMPDIIREAPLGPERDAVTDRFLTFLEEEMDHPSSRLPRYHILRCIERTVYGVLFVVPERNGERVKNQLFKRAEDSDPRVRAAALYLLQNVSHTEDATKRKEYLEFFKTRRDKESVAQDLTPEWRREILAGVDGKIDHMKWYVDNGLEVIGEREYRALPDASTDGLLELFLGQSGLRSQCALNVLGRREDTQTRVLHAAEARPGLWRHAVLEYAVSIPATANASSRKRVDDLIACLKAVLEAPYTFEVKGRTTVAVKALGWLTEERSYAREFSLRHETIPPPYAKERIVNLLIKALDHADFYTRRDATYCLEVSVQDDPETAARILPELEKRTAQLAEKFGYGKEPRNKEGDRLIKEFGHYPEEWVLYDGVARALDRARRAVKSSTEKK